MKKFMSLLIVVIVVSFLSIVGCAQVQSEKKVTYETISTETAKKRLDTEKGIVLLDVRNSDYQLILLSSR